MNRLLNKTLYIRTLSGAGLLIVVLGAVLWSPYSMLALLLLLTVGSMNEFYRIARLRQASPLRVYPILIGAGIVITSFFVATGAASPRVFTWILPAVFALFIVGLYDKSSTHVENIVWEIGGIVYIAVPMALLTSMPINGVYAFFSILKDVAERKDFYQKDMAALARAGFELDVVKRVLAENPDDV